MNSQGMPLVELANELVRRAEAKRDFVATTDQLGFHADGATAYLTLHQEHFRITEHTHGQIADRLNMPKRYYDRLRQEAPSLWETNVRHWFRETPERRMIRTLKGNARAFLSDRYYRIDNEQIATLVLPILLEAEGVEIVSCAVTDWKLYIQACFPRLEGEVKKGDPVQGGLVISNGELGNGALSIDPLVYRLVCENGLIAGTVMPQGRLRRQHVGQRVMADDNDAFYTDETRAADDYALLLKIRDTVSALVQPERFHTLLQALRHAAEGPAVAQPVAAVEELGKAYALTQGERQSILTRLLQGADYSRWGVVNAVTGLANEHASYDRAVELEQLGGKLLGLSAQQWQPIAHAGEAMAASC